MGKSKLIHLSFYGSTEVGYSSLRNEILKSFGRGLFEFRSMEEIVFETLKLIDKTSRVSFTKESLTENILIVLKHFKLEDAKLLKVREAFDGKKKKEAHSVWDNFYCFILGFDKLPKTQLIKIRREVEKDLKEMNELIAKYESQEVVQKLMLGKEVHGSNNAVIHLYGRCLKERQNILDFYLKEMYNRAFQMSKYGMDEGTRTYLLNTVTYRPYNFNHLAFATNYDFQYIECSWHRMYSSDMIASEGMDLAKVYREDKDAFYKKFFEVEPIEKIFERIGDYLLILPLQEQRKQIIVEAQRLFKAKEWLAFYAIVLPQVEGLFMEMCEVSKTSGQKDSLPKKVRAIRDYSEGNDIMLDYYEYILPAQRNKFAHGGLPDNPQILAFDILTDLENVLYLYSDLSSPLMKVTRLITRRNPYDFLDYTSYTGLFEAINDFTPQELKHISDKITSFNSEYLVPIEDILNELTKVAFNDFYSNRDLMNKDLKQKGFPVLGSVADMAKAVNYNEALITGFYFEAMNVFANSYFLDSFFSSLKKYSRRYLNSNFLKDGIAKWEAEKKTFRNIKQLADYFNSKRPVGE